MGTSKNLEVFVRGVDAPSFLAAQAGENRKEALIKSFDRLRTNGKLLIPFVLSLSNHERNPFFRTS
jgi:hypothetical protein